MRPYPASSFEEVLGLAEAIQKFASGALTDLGKIATSSDTPAREKLAAQFKLAIEDIEPFKYLYDQYKGKKLPSHEVMKDALRESGVPVEDEQEVHRHISS